MRGQGPPEVPAGIRPSSKYIRELECLRGVAIALVFVFHADSALLFPFRNRVGQWPSLPLAFVWAGHTGVTLFFVLSAFLLSMPFLEASYGGRAVSRRDFYARRALRILPLYYAMVLAAGLVTAQAVADVGRAIPYLAFLESKPGWTVPLPPFSGVWWSLATEIQFYALLPFVALTFGRSWPVTLAVLALYTIAYASVALGWMVPGMEPWFRAQSVVGRGPLFVFGILAAWLYQRHGETLRARLAARRWLRAGGGDVVLLAVLIALGLLLRWATWHGFMALEPSRRYPWHVGEGALWTLVVLLLLLVPLRMKPLLVNPLLARLGVLSYSIYLLHQPVLHYSLRLLRLHVPGTRAAWDGFGAGWFVVATLVCLGLAALTWRWIERPFLLRKARLDTRPPAQPPGPAPLRAAGRA